MTQIARVAQTLAVDAMTCRVVAELRAVHIEPVILKGPSFAAWLYPEDRPRPYSDTDLLVDAADLSRAEQVLRRLNFEPSPPPPGPSPMATTWALSDGPGTVDLHTGIWLVGEGAELWRELSSHTQQLRLGPLTVTVLDDPAKALHVVTHALQHSWAEPGPNTDLERALRQVPDATWRQAAQLADRLNASDAFAFGLGGTPAGRQLVERIGVRPPSRASVHLRLLASGAALAGAGTVDDFARLDGWRPRFGFVWRKLFPPSDFASSVVSPERSLTTAAPVVYLRYWAHLGRRAPGAVRSWRETLRR